MTLVDNASSVPWQAATPWHSIVLVSFESRERALLGGQVVKQARQQLTVVLVSTCPILAASASQH